MSNRRGKAQQRPQGRSMAPRRRQQLGAPISYPNAVCSQVATFTAVDRGQSRNAGGVMQQLLDPCHAPDLPIPDGTHGRSESVRSITRFSFQIEGTGQRGIIVNPTANDMIEASGAAVYATWLQTDDSSYAGILNSGAYKYIRLKSMCVKFVKTSAFDTSAGIILGAAMPEIDYLDRTTTTASLTFLTQEPHVAEYAGDAVPEFLWKPRNIADFAPFIPAALARTGVDINGRDLSRIPSMHFELTGGDATNTKFTMIVTKRYECFLGPASQARGADNYVQDTVAMDKVMSSVSSVKWSRFGDNVDKVSGYAASVARVLGGPAAGSAVGAVGSAVSGVSRALSKL